MGAPAKSYLGDGVYVALDYDGASIVLTTEDGLRATNRVYLEPNVMAELLRWYAATLGVEAKPRAQA